AHTHPNGADDLTFDGDRVEGTATIMSGPDFVDRDFAGVFIYCHFGDLRGVGIGRRWAYACAFVFAAAGFGRRCVGAGTGQGTVEIDGRHDRFLERHGVFRALVFALLLERAAKDLTFYTAGNRCVR